MKSMRCIRFIIFFTVLLLSECSYTEGILELKGKVMDENTSVALPNRKVVVQALEKDQANFKSTYVGEFTTDSSGHFAYSLTKVKNIILYDFSVVGDSAYAFSSNKIDLNILNNYGKQLNFKVCRLADFAIKIERISKMPRCDTLFVSWKSDGLKGEIVYPYKIENVGFTSDVPLRFIGGHIKSVIKTKVYADKMTIVNWELFRNGKAEDFIDTIFCKGNDANSLNFKY